MNRKHSFVPAEFYHLYNRGNSKQRIFLDDNDRIRFLKFLYLSNSEKNVNFRNDIVRPRIDAWEFDRGRQLVSIGAWVLMPNHFHIYLTPKRTPKTPKSKTPKSDLGKDEENVTHFMRKLCTSYSKYFNVKYKRTGGLFESNFKSIHIGTDEQAKYLFSYIHLNPVKLINPKWREIGISDSKKVLAFLNGFRWSSYQDFRNMSRVESRILSLDDFPKYFRDSSVFDNEIFEWLTFNEQ